MQCTHAQLTIIHYTNKLKSAQDQVTEATTYNTSTTVQLMNIQCLMAETSAMQSFKDFVQQKAETDDTWRFWSNFVLKDCFSYICLFLAIRTSSWDLRMLALKSMSCLFSAYDRPSYSKTLPNHLADIPYSRDYKYLSIIRTPQIQVPI